MIETKMIIGIIFFFGILYYIKGFICEWHRDSIKNNKVIEYTRLYELLKEYLDSIAEFKRKSEMHDDNYEMPEVPKCRKNGGLVDYE